MKVPKLDMASVEALLAQMPEEDREEARKAILEAFSPENVGPDGLPRGAVLVRELPAGTTNCPDCGLMLTRLRHAAGDRDGQDCYECARCDASFLLPACDA